MTRQASWIGVIAVLGALILACAGLPADEAEPGSTMPAPRPSAWYGLYFTDPESPVAESLRGGVDEYLVQAIDQAEVSVDAAVYELYLWSIRDALLRAQARGVTVRIVTERSSMAEDEIRDLLEAGIPVVGDTGDGLMHHKFLVIDRQEVWSGSLNLTITDVYRNHNNLLRLRSSRLADDYTTEFEEMFERGRFGAESSANTPYPELSIEGTPVQVCFSPDDGCLELILETVQQAEQAIQVLAFSFTSDALAEALIEQSALGIHVSGVLDAGQVASNQGGDYERLRSAGLDFHLDANPYKLHHKVIIIDDRIVITGSYNFTQSAENRNDENVLIIHNPVIAQAYRQEFERIYGQAQR